MNSRYSRRRTVLTMALAAAFAAGAPTFAESPACFSSDSQCLVSETFGSIDLKLKGGLPLLSFERPAVGATPAQVWQLDAGNTNFLLRNATGSRLPFWVDRNAPTNSLAILNGGRVSINTTHSADVALWVRASGTGAPLTLENLSRQWVLMVNATGSDGLLSLRPSIVNTEPTVFTLAPTGSLTLAGSVTATAFLQSSDRAAKTGFASVDPERVLRQVLHLPLSEWQFKGQNDTHIGPMAQDFHAAFGYGPDDKHVSPADLASVALAAIQGLEQRLAERDAELTQLRQRLERLEQR